MKTPDTKIVVVIALLLAILFPAAAEFLKDYLVYILIFIVSISIKKLGSEHLDIKRKEFVLELVLLNLIGLTTLYIILSHLLISNELYRNAIIIYALMPPAIGIISLGYLYHVDMKVDMYAEFISYMLAIVMIPVGTYFLLSETIAPVDIIEVLIFLLFVPFIISRAIKKVEIPDNILKTIINLSFGFVVFTIVGFNIDMIADNIGDITNILIMFTILRIGLMLGIYYFLKKRIKHRDAILFTMFGTMKNGAAATAIVLMLLGPESTVPMAIEVVFFSVTLIIMDFIFKRNDRKISKAQKS